jgi:hypothetical protein
MPIPPSTNKESPVATAVLRTSFHAVGNEGKLLAMVGLEVNGLFS